MSKFEKDTVFAIIPDDEITQEIINISVSRSKELMPSQTSGGVLFRLVEFSYGSHAALLRHVWYSLSEIEAAWANINFKPSNPIPKINNLLNGASKAMNVNGSITPVTFSFAPLIGKTRLKRLSVLLSDEGLNSFGNFGAIAGLVNGLLIQLTIGGSNKTITTIRSNADLCTMFSSNHFGSSAVLNILGVTTPVGFGNTNNVFIGHINFDDLGSPLFLSGGDSISVVVQDNLVNIGFLEMAIAHLVE